MFSHTGIKTSELNYFTIYLQENNESIDDRLHSHDEYELFILLEGDLSYEIEEQRYQPKPVQIVVVPPHANHRFIVDTKNPKKILLRGIMIHFSTVSNESSVFFKDLLSVPSLIDIKSYPEIIILTHNITHYSYMFSKEEFQFVRHGLICQLLMLLWKYSAYNISTGKNTNPLTSHVLAYINQHIAENPTLETISNHFKFNKIYVNRIFKRDMGIPLHSYIQSRKILLAKTLIFGGEKPTQAMAKSGFSEYSSFYRLFIRTYGISPQKMYVQYRKEMISNPYINNVTKKDDKE